MVNTVGSFETKYWQKKWIELKRKLVLTQRQIDIIVGSLLGDGTMRIGKKAKNANLKLEHKLLQREYVEWKYKILKSFVLTPPKISYRYDKEGRRYEKSWWFRTIRHPLLTQFYFQFYKGDRIKTGGKIVPKDIKEKLNPLVVAIWIMDDGSFSNDKIDLSTYGFSLSDIVLLQKAMKEKFRLSPRYYQDRDKGFRMYFSKRDSERLIKIIQPYIIPSMKYKIGFKAP